MVGREGNLNVGFCSEGGWESMGVGDVRSADRSRGLGKKDLVLRYANE